MAGVVSDIRLVVEASAILPAEAALGTLPLGAAEAAAIVDQNGTE